MQPAICPISLNPGGDSDIEVWINFPNSHRNVLVDFVFRDGLFAAAALPNWHGKVEVIKSKLDRSENYVRAL